MEKKAQQQTKKRTKATASFSPTRDDLVFLPLGGTEEVGMNLSLLGHDGEWLAMDCGVTFHDRLGIDILTADPSFLVQNHIKLQGLLITHAHEDHIGAVEYLWPLLKCPIYASPFALAVLRQKLGEKVWFEKVPLIEVNFKKPTQIGKFSVEFVAMTHSIPEPACLVVRTPLGTVVHTGDWKFDPRPTIGKKVDEKVLKRIGDEGVLAYLSDSTNIFVKEDDSSEEKVREEMTRLILENKDRRITVACFSSNIARLETAILAAKQAGRKVAVMGRSLQRMITAAKETGYLKDLPQFVDDKTAISMPPGKVLFLCTGSQGEARSALMRIAGDGHPVVKLSDKDLVLFSSRVIPGNEKSIGVLHSLLASSNADIITASEEDIHASGHPSCKSIQKMYGLLRPQIVVPVHGEARHLIAQAHFAREQGIKQVLTPSNGKILQLAGDKPGIVGEVVHGRWAVDGKRMIIFDSNIVKERQRLSEQGAVLVTLTVDKNGIEKAEIDLLGLTEPGPIQGKLLDQLQQALVAAFANTKQISASASHIELAKQKVRQTVNAKLGKQPQVRVHIVQR